MQWALQRGLVIVSNLVAPSLFFASGVVVSGAANDFPAMKL
jgi:hypothetical protein